MTIPTALESRWIAVQAGISRGCIETRQSLTEMAYLVGQAVLPAIYIVALMATSKRAVPGMDFSLSTMLLPSLLGMSVVFGGISGPASAIAVDLDEGTLLRAKATPNGLLGYLVGKIVMVVLTTILSLIAILIPGA